MKKIIVTLSLVGLVVLPAAAEGTNGSPWTPSVTFRTTVSERYPSFGSGSILYDKWVIQSDLCTSFRNGVYIDLWNSTPLTTGWNKNLGSEQDLGIGWNGNVKGISMSLGSTYFDEPDLGTIGKGDTLYTHLTLSKQFYCDSRWKSFGVNAEFENYTTMPESGFQGGNLYSVGASKSLSFFKDRVSANTSLSLVYDDGGFGFDSGMLLRGYAGLDVKISKRVCLTPIQVLYYAPLTVRDSRELIGVLSASLSIKIWN